MRSTTAAGRDVPRSGDSFKMRLGVVSFIIAIPARLVHDEFR
jgi:hypothetical protein